MRRGDGIGLGRWRNREYSALPSGSPTRTASLQEMLSLVWPFMWPHASTESNRSPNQSRVLFAWTLIVTSKVCSLTSPLMLQSSVNALVNTNLPTAIHFITLHCILRLSAHLLKETQSIIYMKVTQQATANLLHHTFQHIHSLSFSWHVAKKTGNVVRIMDRGVSAINTLTQQIFFTLLPALIELTGVVLIFFTHYRLFSIGILLIVAVIIFSYATIQFTIMRSKYRQLSNKLDNDYHHKATDSILNYETVKYFASESREVSSFFDAVTKHLEISSSAQTTGSLLSCVQQAILISTLLIASMISARKVVSGHMSIGTWVALLSWITQVFVPLNQLGWVYGSVLQALVDTGNLIELLQESSDVYDDPDAADIDLKVKFNNGEITSTGVTVDFKNVFFHYPTQNPDRGIRDVTFHVAAGSTTALVGHTGAGKTTLSRILFRFYDPISGGIRIDGKDIKKYTQKSVREAIGIVPQDTVLFNDSILHNIKYGRPESTMKDVEAAADAAQILSFIRSLPEGWETIVGERGLKLSGGEKQRVSIARCLLKDPSIVVLDEATSALDTVTEASVQEALLALRKNRTVIIIAHRLSTINRADQIVVLDHGQVAESGSHGELLERGGHYSTLWSMQIREGYLSESKQK